MVWYGMVGYSLVGMLWYYRGGYTVQCYIVRYGIKL